MLFFRAVVLFCFCLAFASAGVCRAAPAATPPAILWKELEPGLQLARVDVRPSPPAASPAQPSPVPVTLLRIDPARYAFDVYMASEKGPKTLGDIAISERYAAAINAGMYLPDRLTSTGYLKTATHVNNPRLAGGFGAFFVAETKGKAPRARLLDKSKHDWKNIIERYDVVLQNYRMNTPDGRVIWKQAERLHSMAALSEDKDGRILFILCPRPVQAADFVAALLRLPLRIETVMYLEGGSEAALLIRAGTVDAVEAGRHPSGLWSGGAGLILPNVLGIRKR